MNDLISKSALIERYCGACKYPMKKRCEEDPCPTVHEMMESPVVEAEPVRHGRWIKCPGVKGKVHCSECKTVQAVHDSNYRSIYCPGCGCRMDKKNDNEEDYR